MLAVTVRLRSLILASWSLSFIRSVRLLLLLVLKLQCWPSVCSSGSSHLSRGRLPCITEEQEAVVSLLLSGHNVASSHLVSLWSCGRCARSMPTDDDGKIFAATFYHYHWTGCHRGRTLHSFFGVGCARRSAALIASQVLANDEASEPTRIRKTRVLLVARGEVSAVSASCYVCLRRLDFVARVARAIAMCRSVTLKLCFFHRGFNQSRRHDSTAIQLNRTSKITEAHMHRIEQLEKGQSIYYQHKEKMSRCGKNMVYALWEDGMSVLDVRTNLDNHD